MTTHPESPDGVETAKRGKPSCDLRKRASTKRSSPVVLDLAGHNVRGGGPGEKGAVCPAPRRVRAVCSGTLRVRLNANMKKVRQDGIVCATSISELIWEHRLGLGDTWG